MESVIVIVILAGLAVLFGLLYVPELVRLYKRTEPDGGTNRSPFILAIAGLMSAVLAGAFGVEAPPPSTNGEAQAHANVVQRTASRIVGAEDAGTLDWKKSVAYVYMLYYILIVFCSVGAVAVATAEHLAKRPEVRAIAWGGIGVLIAIAKNTLL